MPPLPPEAEVLCLVAPGGEEARKVPQAAEAEEPPLRRRPWWRRLLGRDRIAGKRGTPAEGKGPGEAQ